MYSFVYKGNQYLSELNQKLLRHYVSYFVDLCCVVLCYVEFYLVWCFCVVFLCVPYFARFVCQCVLYFTV